MQPGLDDIQQSLNKAIQLVLDIFKGVYLLGQEREPNVEINRKSLLSNLRTTLSLKYTNYTF
jgi:hypothetical protein